MKIIIIIFFFCLVIKIINGYLAWIYILFLWFNLGQPPPPTPYFIVAS
jgi:hypothetical protein